jgi:hypothetical protein
MSLTLRLQNHTYAARNYLGIEIGAPFNIMIATDMLGQGAFEDPAGWFELADAPLQPVLMQIERARHAFAGKVRRRFVWEDEDLTIAYLLLDTPTPITLLASTFGDLPPDVQEGDWVYGIATLNLYWEDDLDIPLGQPIQVVVEDIQRLFLHPGPGFGISQSVASLPPEPFEPDQVLLALRSKR